MLRYFLFPFKVASWNFDISLFNFISFHFQIQSKEKMIWNSVENLEYKKCSVLLLDLHNTHCKTCIRWRCFTLMQLFYEFVEWVYYLFHVSVGIHCACDNIRGINEIRLINLFYQIDSLAKKEFRFFFWKISKLIAEK